MNGTRRLLAVALSFLLVGCGAGTGEWLKDIQSPTAEVRRVAAEQLAEKAEMSDEVIGALSKASGDSDPEVRRWACRGLGRHGASGSVSELEARLRDPAVAVRRAAALSLQTIAPETLAYRDELIAGMRTGDGGLLVAVRQFQPPATWAMPVLLDLVKDRRPGIRRLAVEAIGEIAPATEASRKALETARRDPDDRVRAAAEKALKSPS